MSYDFSLGRGPTKSSKHNAGKANTIDVPVIGIVKDNIDPTRAGRLKVFLTTNLTPLDPDNSDNWTTVNYLSGFFGSTRPSGGKDDFGVYKRNPSSYGEWHSPPDIGSKVICVFVNGDPDFGFYIGCIPDPEDLYMVPAIGASENIIANEGEAQSYGGAVRLPVTNFNKDNKELSESPTYLESPRPVHSYSAAIMAQQGIIRDPIRGPISSSSQREAASRVGWGVSTPGRPIYEGGFNDESVTQNLDPTQAEKLRVISRRGGHSIVMDDGDIVGRDQLIRIRTALGHQILMSDDGQTLMILHSNGQSYVELGKEGTVDVYATNSINMRTDGDINFHAGRNINLHANEDIKTHSKNFQVDTEEELRLRAEDALKMFTLGNFTVKSDAEVAINATGDASMVAGGDAYVNGTKVNLNSGQASTRAEQIEKTPLISQTDTLFDKQQGFIAAPGKLNTITSRTPAHAPWVGAGQGVDIESSLDAEDNLPANPTSGIKNVNNVASEVTPNLTGREIRAPGNAPLAVKPVSSALDQNTTGSMLGILSTDARSNSTAPNIGIGFDATNNNQFVVGAYGQTPNQLANSGYLKPGSDRRVNVLANNLKNTLLSDITDYSISEFKNRAMPASIFTGKPGAKNINSLVRNVGAQTNSMVKNLQKAQTALTAAKALTGKESPTQVAGVVLASSKFGTKNTLETIKQVAGSSNASSSIGRGVLQQIGKGSIAAQVATTAIGGQGGIASALRSMDPIKPGGLLDLSKGVSGSAFNAIKQSFVPLQANVPQNLKQIAQQAGFGPVTGDTNLLSQTASIVQKGAAASLSSLLASGINNIPGGQKIASAVLNNAPNAINRIPGTQELQTEINRLLGGATPSLNLNNPGSLVNSAVSNLTNDLAAQVQSAASALSSGGVSDVKLPTASFNTNNRQAISAQVDTLLFDPGIPPPNLVGEISDQATQAVESVEEEGREVFTLLEDFEARREEIISARNAFYEAESTFPPGDPRIEEAKNEWFALLDDPEYQDLVERIGEVRGTGEGFLSNSQIADVDFNNLGDNPTE